MSDGLGQVAFAKVGDANHLDFPLVPQLFQRLGQESVGWGYDKREHGRAADGGPALFIGPTALLTFRVSSMGTSQLAQWIW